jgi:hypothetical protein
MDIPTELPGILSWFGLLAGAVALAYWLPKGADWVEADAKEERLKYISELLKKGLTSFGPLGALVVPFVFDKIFGSRPISFKFISRSILASILFWLILILVKRPDWRLIWNLEFANQPGIPLGVPIMLFIDWVSLTKARFILNSMVSNAGPPEDQIFYGRLSSLR